MLRIDQAHPSESVELGSTIIFLDCAEIADFGCFFPWNGLRYDTKVDIEASLKDLGPVKIGRLLEAVNGLTPENWSAQRIRQNEYEVHSQTESVVLVFTDGAGWPELEVRKEQGWDLLADTAVPVMLDVLAAHYPAGGTIFRSMIAARRKRHKAAR